MHDHAEWVLFMGPETAYMTVPCVFVMMAVGAVQESPGGGGGGGGMQWCWQGARARQGTAGKSCLGYEEPVHSRRAVGLNLGSRLTPSAPLIQVPHAKA